ncbi:MAG: N-formylglutamate amidohydrolase [Alphaproteobacteria bacterium]|nr:N-formylglutamate amidohydrolase [Alphaproteobacteria bacterium]
MAIDSNPLPFEILAPAQWTAPVVFNSPHSGRRYAADFLRQVRLSPMALRKSEDCYVDELFMGCLDHGAPLLRAHTPRCYIDVNREPYELDPRMFIGALPGYANSSSPRVAGGLGTIPRVVAEGEEIYRERMPVAEALARVERVYVPYHRTLSALTGEVLAKVGHVLLLDCHSMPSSATHHVVPVASGPVDVVLGDRYGSSCDETVTACLESLLKAKGFRVLRNKPYAGGFITQNHGAPLRGRHALQIEINRGLYMNEVSLEKSRDFEALRAALTAVTGRLLREVPQLLSPHQLAAE